MKINGAPPDQRLHEWAKDKRPDELLRIDWLNKAIEKTPAEELAGHNPAINIILSLIVETRKGAIIPQEKDEQLAILNRQLAKEKLFALIDKSRNNHLSN